MFGLVSPAIIPPPSRDYSTCCDCGTPFGDFVKTAHSCSDGLLCKDCAEAREALEEE